MKKLKNLTILAIETSCDDTAVAILEASKDGCFPAQGTTPAGGSASGMRPASGWKVLSSIVSSQIEIHKKWGGVYPTLAKREHQKNLPLVFKKALKESGLGSKGTKINLIAVTNGPGLEPCLWVGVNFAKSLSSQWNLPIIPVNHIEAHILANFINKSKIIFPAICLVVSGGHTQLILMRGIGKYKILGETRDDAAGECFDKTAKILGLEYPGGPVISQEAKKHSGPTSIVLPRPMIFTKDYDFSFSGLKTAVLYNFKNQPEKIKKSKKYIKEMCAEIQQAVIDVLIKKTIKAAKDYRTKTLILGGGVSSNEELKKQFIYKLQTTNYKLNLLVPPANLSTDNAVMVGIAAYFNRNKRTSPKKIQAEANLRIG